MHPDEVDTSPGLVRSLLVEQAPRWSELPIELVISHGTDHDIYRIGADLVARLPRVGWATAQVSKEREWLHRMAPHLPLAIPVQVYVGEPGAGYPHSWSVCEWLPGESASAADLDLDQAAASLAEFISALRGIDTSGAHPRRTTGRGAPLAELDDAVRQAIAELGDRVDGAAVTRCWEESLAAPPSGDEVWVHGDLLPGNLLVLDGRLSAVIDFGGLNVGDPACDLQPAWNVFAGRSRAIFRAALDVDDAAWLRGRGWALFQAVLALPYYWETNTGIVHQAKHALTEILVEAEGR